MMFRASSSFFFRCGMMVALLAGINLSYLVGGEVVDPTTTTTHEHAGAGPCVPDNNSTGGKPLDWEAPNDALKRVGGGGGKISCTNNVASGYPCSNVHLESVVPLRDLHYQGSSFEANDVWGWTDAANNDDEYAIIGLETGTSFVDISDPSNPVVVGYLPRKSGASKSWWGDMKTYKDHVFIVADSSYGSQMLVYDLTQLADLDRSNGIQLLSPTLVYDEFSEAHNIVINEDSGFAYVVGSDKCNGGLHMVNINDPTNPTFAGCYSNRGYTHDAQCVMYAGPDGRYTDKEICFAYNEDKVDIVDVSDKNSPRLVGTFTYSDYSYTHQGWLTEDQHHIIINDETDSGATRIIIADVSTLDDPSHVGDHIMNHQAIDHNLYVKDNHVYQAQYSAGLRIFNLDAVADGVLDEVAYFDVYTNHDSHSFNGAWSVYPYFASGVVVVSGIEQGLFVLRPDLDALPTTDAPVTPSSPTPSPIDDNGNDNGNDNSEPEDEPTSSPTAGSSFESASYVNQIVVLSLKIAVAVMYQILAAIGSFVI